MIDFGFQSALPKGPRQAKPTVKKQENVVLALVSCVIVDMTTAQKSSPRQKMGVTKALASVLLFIRVEEALTALRFT